MCYRHWPKKFLDSPGDFPYPSEHDLHRDTVQFAVTCVCDGWTRQRWQFCYIRERVLEKCEAVESGRLADKLPHVVRMKVSSYEW